MRWCPHCYRMGCMHCNGTGFIGELVKKQPKYKTVQLESQTEPVELTKWQIEDMALDAAYKRWEVSLEKKEGISFDEFLMMEFSKKDDQNH